MKAIYLVIIILIVAAVLIGFFVMKSQKSVPAETPENNGQIEQPADVSAVIGAIDSINNDLDNLNSSASSLDENTDLSKAFQGQ